VEPLETFDTNAYRIGNDFIEQLNINDVLIKVPGDAASAPKFVKTNISDGILRNPVITETGKTEKEIFGKVTGTLYAKIEKKEPLKNTETGIPVTPEKEVSYRKKVSNFIKPRLTNKGLATRQSRWGCLPDAISALFFLFILSSIFKGFMSLFLFSTGILLIVGIIFLLGLFFRFLRAITNILSILFVFVIMLMALSYFYSNTSRKEGEHEAAKFRQQDEQSETSVLLKDTVNKEFDKTTCGNNPLMAIHKRAWLDFKPQRYEGKLIMSQCYYNQSRENRESLNPESSHIITFYNKLYTKLSISDRNKMNLIYTMFDSIRNAKKLGEAQFADLIVTCVQDIPYRLVIDNPADLDGRMLQLYRRDGALEHIKFGVQAPAEFMYNLQGDCDTRALFCFTVLDHFGYDAAILISEYYAHAILGLAIPSTGASINHRGKRYFTWETTAKGFQLGQMAPDCSNMNYWEIVLTNR
jgi:hypothetical protein